MRPAELTTQTKAGTLSRIASKVGRGQIDRISPLFISSSPVRVPMSVCAHYAAPTLKDTPARSMAYESRRFMVCQAEDPIYYIFAYLGRPIRHAYNRSRRVNAKQRGEGELR